MGQDIVVLKFGSSVLTSPDSLPQLVHEVYRWVRDGWKVVVVVSAFQGETARLWEEAARIGGGGSYGAKARLIGIGERRAVAAMLLSLDDAGLVAIELDEFALSVVTEGNGHNDIPVSVDHDRIVAAFARCSVVVVPGYVGIGSAGNPTLLGRGGSDLTALFLAEALDASRCRLVKDVDGWFDRDPRVYAETARKYASLSFADAAGLDAELVQTIACEFAARHHRSFEVGALGSIQASVVGSVTELGDHGSEDVSQAPLRVALMGLGTVGSQVAVACGRVPQRFEVVAALVRDLSKRRPIETSGLFLTDSLDAFFQIDADVVVELVGDEFVALDAIERSIELNRDVVSANKSLFSVHGRRLALAARARGVALCFSAAVGGAVPMLELTRLARGRGEVEGIRAILNGTSGFVIDRMKEGVTVDLAIREAIARGICEADPTLDLNGEDSASKLRLLCREAFGADSLDDVVEVEPELMEPRVSQNQRPGIDRVVCEAERVGNRVRATVSRKRIAPSDPLGWNLRGTICSIEIRLRGGEIVHTRGSGAGGRPSAESVIGDLAELSRRRMSPATNSVSNRGRKVLQ